MRIFHAVSYSAIFSAVVLCALFAAMPARAATFRGGQEYVLPESSVVEDNLHLLGNNLTVDGTVEGDLAAAAGRVEINGTVRDDVLVAGGVVEINGNVGGDVRAAGGQVIVRGTVGGDILALGGTIEIMEEASSTGDVALYGDRLIMNGTAGQALLAKGNILELSGAVGADVQADIDEGIVVGDSAKVSGDFIYSARNRALISDVALENIGGAVDFTPLEPENRVVGVLSSYFNAYSIIKLLSVMAATLAFFLLFPRFSERVVRYTIDNTGRTILIGGVMWIVVPLAAIVLALTVVGIVPALGIGFGYLTLLVLAKIMAGILAGAMLANIFKKGYVIDWRYAALGVFALFLIGLVPVAGFLISLVLYWMVIGSIAFGMYAYWWRGRNTDPAPVTAMDAHPAPHTLSEVPDNLPIAVENGEADDRRKSA